MNQLTNHTEKKIEVINPAMVMGTVKGIVPRSFEKTFSGLTTEQIAYSFKICLDGLTRDQIAMGMSSVRDNGFCPDPAMFRKWCLGIKGFINDTDPVKDSYKGKYAAIANIEAWLSDPSTLITNAEREAYNRVYGMFDQIQWSNNPDRQKFYAYEAFKDAYVEVVKEFIMDDVYQGEWIEPKKIEKPRYQAKPFDYLADEKTDEEKKKIQEIIAEAQKAIKRQPKGI